jgi:hypothetical protein
MTLRASEKRSPRGWAIVACLAVALGLGGLLAASLRHARQSPTLLIAPHISGETFCDAAVDDPKITNEEDAATVCTAKGQNAADRIEAALGQIGPPLSPSGKYALGYTLNLPLMRFYVRDASGAWVLDKAAIANATKIIHDVHRPVVVYMSANHFTDGGIKLSDELAKNPANLMWTKDGPLEAYNYFVVSLHAWTLADPDAPITEMRRRAFSAVLDSLCALDAGSRSRIAGLSVLGEVHQLWGHYDAGQGYAADFDITDYAPKAVAGFHNFLQAKFSDIAALNKMAGSSFRSFAEVVPPSKDIRKDHLNNFFEHIDPYAAGSVAIQGWAVDPSGKPVQLAIYLDGKLRGKITANLNRSDVPEADPTVTTPNVGWRYDLDFRSEADGVHTLEVFRVAPDGGLIRVTKRGLTVVPRNQSPSLPLTSLPVEARDPDPKSPVRVYIDAPAPLTALFYNPVAALWLEYRNKMVTDYITLFAKIADKSCLSPDIVFSHQLMPELNSSWDHELMAVDASQKPNTNYHQGTTLYGGAAWGDAFFDWETAHGWDGYAVSEMHPRFSLPRSGFEAMFDAHRTHGARFVAPYFLSIAPQRLRLPMSEGLNLMLISPENHHVGSDGFYNAMVDLMQHQ